MAKPSKKDKPAEDPLAEGVLIEGSDDLSPIVESAEIIVPKKGKLFEEKMVEGQTVKVAKFAIIRPCQSKGKSIRGLQPIYEPSMLAEHAGVFKGWQMFLDHVSEQIVEAWEEFLQERGRSTKELGGRVLRSWYDPEVTFESDDDNGYRKGAVVGEVIPYKMVREMLEDDPLALAVSINAWPTKARIGRASWNTNLKGAVIEGIRSKPQGSVDFVPRGGAGGRLLTESELASEVSLLERAYTAARADEKPDSKERPVKKKLSEMSEEEVASLTPEGLAEALREENPQLAEAVTKQATKEPAREGDGGTPLTQADLDAALTKQREALVEEFGGTREAAEELAEEMVQEARELEHLAKHAEKKITEAERNGLPKRFADEIRKNYLLLPSGPRNGLLVQEREDEESGKTLSVEEVLEAQIRADIETAVELIEEAGGRAPRIKGLGPSGTEGETPGSQEKPKGLREGTALHSFLRESGDITGNPEKDEQRLAEILEG